MKIILIGFLSFISLSLNSQSIIDSIPLDPETGRAKFEKVFEVVGTKEELFSKAKLWVVEMFVSAKDVIQAEDKNEGFITGKGILTYTYQYYYNRKKGIEPEKKPNESKANFSFKIFLKDNKVKVIIADVTFLNYGLDPFVDGVLSKQDFETARKLSEGKPGDQTRAMIAFSQYRGLKSSILALQESLQAKLSKKSETDF